MFDELDLGPSISYQGHASLKLLCSSAKTKTLKGCYLQYRLMGVKKKGPLQLSLSSMV